MSNSEGISLGFARCSRATDKAILVELEEEDSRWIPQSCVHDDSEVWEPGQSGDLVVVQWWAEKEGLS